MKDIYASTRAEWARIWEEETNLERELKTLDYRRARYARALYHPFLPRDGLILEGGCGLGIEVINLESQGCKVVGVDYAVNALVQLNRYKPGYRLAAGDVHHLPFREGAFGAYLSIGVLEHFDFGPAPGLHEAHRVLRPDGILVLIIPYPNLVWRLVQLKKRLARPKLRPPAFYETTYTTGQLRQHLAAADFEVLAQHPIGHSFTLWGVSRLFRGPGYYETSAVAERLGDIFSKLLPWSMCFESLIIARKS